MVRAALFVPSHVCEQLAFLFQMRCLVWSAFHHRASQVRVEPKSEPALQHLEKELPDNFRERKAASSFPRDTLLGLGSFSLLDALCPIFGLRFWSRHKWCWSNCKKTCFNIFNLQILSNVWKPARH